jgi:hypothetical protein
VDLKPLLAILGKVVEESHILLFSLGKRDGSRSC